MILGTAQHQVSASRALRRACRHAIPGGPLSEEAAGDFYLYLFEQGRIFRRVQSFAGKNAIQFETYLSYYMLRDLCLEWVRTTERVDVISLDLPVTGAEATDERTVALQDVLSAEDPTPEAMLVESD